VARYDKGLKIPTRLFEAAALGRSIKPICGRCGNEKTTFESIGLWYYFKRRSWNDDLNAARFHFWCRQCGFEIGKRVRPRILEIVKESADDKFLARPSEIDWKNELKRWRG